MCEAIAETVRNSVSILRQIQFFTETQVINQIAILKIKHANIMQQNYANWILER